MKNILLKDNCFLFLCQEHNNGNSYMGTTHGDTYRVSSVEVNNLCVTQDPGSF